MDGWRRVCWLPLLAALLVGGCGDDDGGTTGPGNHGPFYGGWAYINNSDDGNNAYIYFSDSTYYNLQSEAPGWRTRYNASYTYDDETITLDGRIHMSYNLNNDSLSFGFATYVRDPSFTNPDSWVKHITVLDSFPSHAGDLGFAGTTLYEAAGNLYMYDVDPLVRVDSSGIGSSLFGVTSDGESLWLGFWSDTLIAVDPVSFDTTMVGPRIPIITSLAWGEEKLWIHDAWDDVFFSYSPTSGTFQDSLVVDIPVSDGIAYLNGYLYYCVDHNLHKCQISPFRVVQSWQFPSQSVINQTLSTVVRYMATDGERVWLNTQVTDGTVNGMIYEVRL